MRNHIHDDGRALSEEARAILQRGLTELLRITEGKVFQPVASERYPLPLALAVYGEVPDPEQVRSEVRAGVECDPVRRLESALVLLELYACNQPDVCASTPDDDAFLTQVFASKRMNGWIALLGDSNQEEIQAAVNARWQFKFIVARDFALPPQRIGESLIAAVRNEFPRIGKLHAEVIFDRKGLKALGAEVSAERAQRKREIAAANEESVSEFITCVGCSAFAPDHVCFLAPERPPQCGRAYEFIKTGALYGYDDMTNIHHRELHSGVNSFGTCYKGELLDRPAGEWSGANQAAARLTGGRITRVQLHSLDEAPHTGCGCFQLILFKTELPKPGIGVMERGYKGHAPDGRTWRDLHYALGGKQTAGLAGAAWGYLQSPKFLAAHGGRKSVVWVSPKVAALLPPADGST